MSKSAGSRNSIFGYLFGSSLAIAILLYILRGVGILTFLPGGIILIAIAMTIITGILDAIDKTRRF